MAPIGPFDLSPPRRRSDGPGIGEVVRQEPAEDERPSEGLGVRDVTGGGHELGEAVVGDGHRLDGEGPQLDGVDRSFPVGGIAHRPDGTHPELSTWQLDRS